MRGGHVFKVWCGGVGKRIASRQRTCQEHRHLTARGQAVRAVLRRHGHTARRDLRGRQRLHVFKEWMRHKYVDVLRHRDLHPLLKDIERPVCNVDGRSSCFCAGIDPDGKWNQPGSRTRGSAYADPIGTRYSRKVAIGRVAIDDERTGATERAELYERDWKRHIAARQIQDVGMACTAE